MCVRCVCVLQTCTFEGPGTSNTTKIRREPPEREKKTENTPREREKKSENGGRRGKNRVKFGAVRRRGVQRRGSGGGGPADTQTRTHKTHTTHTHHNTHTHTTQHTHTTHAHTQHPDNTLTHEKENWPQVELDPSRIPLTSRASRTHLDLDSRDSDPGLTWLTGLTWTHLDSPGSPDSPDSTQKRSSLYTYTTHMENFHTAHMTDDTLHTQTTTA